MTRVPLIAGNWKMNKTVAETEAFLDDFLPRVADAKGVDIAICPTFTSLATAVGRTGDSPVGVFAQNMHERDAGAFTGEVSAPMLVDVGVRGVLLGHSERRTYFNETDRALQQKVPRALDGRPGPDPVRR